MFGDIVQPTHLLFILVVALLVLGPKRLPEVGRQLGNGLRDFRNAINGERDDWRNAINLHPEERPPVVEESYSYGHTPSGASSEPGEHVFAHETTASTDEPLAPGTAGAASSATGERTSAPEPAKSDPAHSGPAVD